MTLPYDAVLLDLDGTLADRHGCVTERTRGVLAALQGRGVRVMLATGRSVGSARRAVEGMAFNAPAVCYNGAVLCDLERDEWVESRTFSEAQAEALVDAVARSSLDLFVYARDVRYTLPSRHAEHERLVEILDGVRTVPLPRDLPRLQVNRLSMMGPDAAALGAIDAVRRDHGAGVYMEVFPFRIIPGFDGFESRFCDVQPPCKGKAEGVRYLRDTHGIDPKRMVAIGDQENDLSMLRAVGLPVAMANASPEVHAVAKRTAPHHDEEGVAGFLEGLFGLPRS
ncbi:MAG: HAD family phosphatase [Planctomycetes bacterium]|nr:HAD family phosphatase [Planctomycetota bacterium]